MALFSRSRQPEAAPQPVKRTRSKPLTVAELGEALDAFSELNPDSTTRRTLGGLGFLCEATTDGGLVKLAGPAPVRAEELDAVLSEDFDVPASAIRVLQRVRAMLAAAEERAEGAAGPVTRKEFDALVHAVALIVASIVAAADRPGYRDGSLDFRLERIAGAPAAFDLSDAERSALKRIMDLARVAKENDGVLQRKHAGDRGNAGGALHF